MDHHVHPLAALAVAVVLGVALAVLFAASKWIERSFFLYAVVLQVTPIGNRAADHHLGSTT